MALAFLSLPREIRDQIYAYLIPADRVIFIHLDRTGNLTTCVTNEIFEKKSGYVVSRQGESDWSAEWRRFSPQLVCKQIHTEFHPPLAPNVGVVCQTCPNPSGKISSLATLGNILSTIEYLNISYAMLSDHRYALAEDFLFLPEQIPSLRTLVIQDTKIPTNALFREHQSEIPPIIQQVGLDDATQIIHMACLEIYVLWFKTLLADEIYTFDVVLHCHWYFNSYGRKGHTGLYWVKVDVRKTKILHNKWSGSVFDPVGHTKPHNCCEAAPLSASQEDW